MKNNLADALATKVKSDFSDPSSAPSLITGPVDPMEQLRKLAVESSLDIPGATGYVDLAKSVTPGALSSKVAF